MKRLNIRPVLAIVLLLSAGACQAGSPTAIPSTSTMKATTSHTATPSLVSSPSASRPSASPTASAGVPLRLMFATQEDDGSGSIRLTRPPIAFAYSDGSPIPPPAWANDLSQARGTFLTWSTDGRFLAFSARESDYAPVGTLTMLEPAGQGIVFGLPEDHDFSILAGGPTWSPDGLG